MRQLENENDVLSTDKLLENAIDGIQNKIAKLRIASYNAKPKLAKQITACADSIQKNVQILKSITGKL